MKRYKMALCLIIAVLMASFILFVEAPNQAKFIVMIIGLIAIAYLYRGNTVYAKATKILARKNPLELNKAIELMEKALDIGCSENNTVIAATLVLQHGDVEKAHAALEEMINSSSKNIRNNAKISLSMYYWMKGDVDKAISLAEEAKAEKQKSANLYVNLCTYYLAKNDKKKFRKTLAEAFSNKATSIALIDIQAIYFILSNDYQKAGVTLEKFFSQREPTYSAPYIHYAMVYLKYGHVRDAIDKLKASLSTSFSNTSLLTKDQIETMIEGLENPETRLKWVDAINNDRTLALKSSLPRIRKIDVERCTQDILPGYPEMPNFKDDSDMSDEPEAREDEDFSAPELNSDDELWLEKHTD